MRGTVVASMRVVEVAAVTDRRCRMWGATQLAMQEDICVGTGLCSGWSGGERWRIGPRGRRGSTRCGGGWWWEHRGWWCCFWEGCRSCCGEWRCLGGESWGGRRYSSQCRRICVGTGLCSRCGGGERWRIGPGGRRGSERCGEGGRWEHRGGCSCCWEGCGSCGGEWRWLCGECRGGSARGSFESRRFGGESCRDRWRGSRSSCGGSWWKPERGWWCSSRGSEACWWICCIAGSSS